MQPHAVSEIAVSLMSKIGRSSFEGELTRSLKRHLAVDAGLILVYRKDKRPRILFNDWQTGRG